MQAKVILVGDANTGKSSLLMRFVRDRFDTSVPTVAPEVGFRTVDGEKQKLKLALWDITGQERFRSVARSYYRGADAAILVCSDVASFLALPHWLREVQQVTNAQLLLLCNKCDEPLTVTDEELEEFCQRHEIPKYLRVSAKSGHQVCEAFAYLADQLTPTAPPPSLKPAPARWCSLG